MSLPRHGSLVRARCDELGVLIARYQAEQREANRSGRDYFASSKLTGAIRRKSMDLTRLLADLRRP